MLDSFGKSLNAGISASLFMKQQKSSCYVFVVEKQVHDENILKQICFSTTFNCVAMSVIQNEILIYGFRLFSNFISYKSENTIYFKNLLLLMILMIPDPAELSTAG